MLEILKVLKVLNEKKVELKGEELQKLLASDGAANDQFGNSASISGDGSAIVIGARYDDDKGDNAGSAYIFN